MCSNTARQPSLPLTPHPSPPPPPRRALARQRVLGLLATPRPFTTIRRKVVIIQRAVRVWLSIRHFELPPDYALVSGEGLAMVMWGCLSSTGISALARGK